MLQLLLPCVCLMLLTPCVYDPLVHEVECDEHQRLTRHHTQQRSVAHLIIRSEGKDDAAQSAQHANADLTPVDDGECVEQIAMQTQEEAGEECAQLRCSRG